VTAAPRPTNVHLRVALALAGLTLLFFSPALLDGRVLAPPGDGTLYYYPMRAHVADVLLRGELPLWNPYLYSGFPLLADSEAGVFYPLNWLFLVLPAPWAMNLVVMSSYFFAAFFTYLYARRIGATPFGGLIAACAYGGGGFMVAHVAHTTIVNAAAWLPLLLYFTEGLRQRAGWTDLAGGAATLAVQVFAGHPQIAAYSMLTAGGYVVFFTLSQPPPAGRLRFPAAALGLVAAGLGLAACQIVPTAELATLSNRAALTFGAFSDPSLPPSHLVLFLFPYAFGGGPAGPYAFSWMGWGLSESTAYLGLLPLALALAALALLKTNPHVRFFWLLAVLGLLLALGENAPLHGLLYRIPGYNLFRAPARHLMEVDLALAVLAALAVTRLNGLRRPMALAAAVTVLVSATLAVLLWRAAPGFGGLLDPGAPSPATTDALRPHGGYLAAGLAFSILAAAAIWNLGRRPGPRAKLVALAVLVADLGVFGPLWYRPFACPTAEALSPASPFLDRLERFGGRPRNDRFLSLNPDEREDDTARNEPNTSLLRRHPTAGGSSSFVLDRYSRLVSWTDFAVGVDLPRAGPGLDLAGVRHLVVAERLLWPPASVQAHGVGFHAREMNVALAPRRRNALEVTLPELRCSALVVDATPVGAPGGHQVEHGTPLLRASARGADGSRRSAVLTVGEPRPAWAVWPAGPGAKRLLWELGSPAELVQLRLEDVAEADALRIERLACRDEPTGRTLVIERRVGPLAHLPPFADRFEQDVGGIASNAIVVVSSLSGPTTIEQGQPIAHVTVRTEDGREFEHVLRAGVHTAEWAWDRPDVRRAIRHRKAPVAESFVAEGGVTGHRYRARLELGARVVVRRLAIEHVGPESSLHVARVELVDDTGGGAVRLPVEAVVLESPADGSGPPELRLPLPPLRASALEIVSSLHHSAATPDGHPVGRIVVSTDGGTVERSLLAGVHTAEWAWDRPDVRRAVRHRRAPVAESFAGGAGFEGHRYTARIPLGGDRRIEELRIENVSGVAALEVARLTFLGADGRAWRFPTADLPATLDRDETTPSVTFEPPALAATEVVVATRLARAVGIAQGEPVARLTAVAYDGTRTERLLRAGEDTSEWQARRRDVTGRLRHREAPVSFTGALWPQQGLWYLSRLALPARQQVRRVVLEAVHPDAVVVLGHASLHDTDKHRSLPLSLLHSTLLGEPRWRRLFAAMGSVVYENRDALPRAWLASRVKALPAADVLEAIRTGRLPEGEPFQPGRLALTEGGVDRDLGPLDPQATVDVVDARNNRLAVDTASATPSVLVVADAYYPGWRASIDGQPAPILQADYAFRAVLLPPGRHRVVFAYRPASFVVGVLVSAATLIILVVLAPLGRRWRALSTASSLLVGASAVLWSAGRAPNRGPDAASPTGLPPLPPPTDRLDVASLPDGAPELVTGFWPAEAWAVGEPGRWTAAEARLRMPRPAWSRGLAVDLVLFHPSGRASGRIEVDGRVVHRFAGENGARREIVRLGDPASSHLDVRFVADQPFASPEAPVGRVHGVFLRRLQLVEEPVDSGLDLATVGRPELVSGWRDVEPWPGYSGRWTGPDAELLLARRGDETGLLVDWSVNHPRGKATARVDVNGRRVATLTGANGRHSEVIDVGDIAGRTLRIRLTVDAPFAPQRYDPASQDPRTLGIFVHAVRLVTR
jgi:hypothetical protein